MPQQAWSNKRERQYEHIKESAQERGMSTKRAKEVAARTVNKERARSRRVARELTLVHAGHVVEPARRSRSGRPAPKARRRSSSTTRRSA